ncbi:iron-siderophore ABC transporter substrate-binding protein [Reinekea sp.]|jgi:iron complex transport system substrate-binding protein|uniref:iron-siderophore ABC transporter substrate-binding protein n=1 Tax=Reinekea sp. TaxID=1970455 RepID=UPI00398979B7
MKHLLIMLGIICSTTMSLHADEFPLTIKHKFGTTVIEEQPTRIASVDFTGADDLLALDVQPVTIRYWYGDYKRAVWPWAEPLLKDTPEILRGDLNIEQIASTNPDVIIALWSGIDQAMYDQLSLIAPVVAVPKNVGDYAMSWDDRALLTGIAIGKQNLAISLIEGINNQLADIAKKNPEWVGKTATMSNVRSDNIGIYSRHDIRAQLLSKIGFSVPKEIDSLTEGENFVVNISFEAIELLDADLVVWMAYSGFDDIYKLTGRPFLNAAKEGREIFMGDQLASALSHASLLSLPFAIEQLEPMIKAALDGDPNTHKDNRND